MDNRFLTAPRAKDKAKLQQSGDRKKVNQSFRINDPKAEFYKPHLKDEHFYATRNDIIGIPVDSEYDKIASMYRANDIVEQHPPITPRKNIPKVTIESRAHNSEYDQILTIGGFNEEKEPSHFTSYIKNNVISSNQNSNEFAPDEWKYDKIINIIPEIKPRKNIPKATTEYRADNSEYDQILTIGGFNEKKESLHFTSYIKNNVISSNQNSNEFAPNEWKYDKIINIIPEIKPRKNIPKATTEYRADNSEYDQILTIGGFNEKKEPSHFTSYIKNNVVSSTENSNEFAPDDKIINIIPEIKPRKINMSSLKSQPGNSKNDQILSTDHPNDKKISWSNTPLTRTQSLTIKELIDTEATYLSKLKHLIEDYLLYFRRIDVSPNIELVFGNIEELHRRTAEMYTEMERSISIDDIAELFINNIDIFDCYVDFSRNKPLSHQWATKAFDQLIKDRQGELDDPHTCESYLLDPVQRPGRYNLLLKKLQKELSPNDESYNLLSKAIALVEEKMQEANTKLTIDCIQWCPVNLNKMGKSLLQHTFNTNDGKEIVAFLFEKCIVCCTEDKSSRDRYNFANCIEMENLSLKHCEWSTSFEISCFDKSKSYMNNHKFQFHLEAFAMEVKKAWVKEIHRILWDQLQYCKDQSILDLNRQKLADSECHYEKIDGTAFHKEIEKYGKGQYYSIGKTVYQESRRAVGTFFDKDFCPRIEIISSEIQTAEYIYTTTILPTQRELLKELIVAEEYFLKDSKECIDAFYSSPGCTTSYERLLFSKIREICNETEILYLNLLKCSKIDDIAIAFLESARLFHYHTDCERYISSYVHISTEFKNKVNKLKQDRCEETEKKWKDYLLRFVSKPPKYRTFLEKLQKQLVQVGQDFKLLRNAIKFVNEKIDIRNTLMNIDSIQSCPFDLTGMGWFYRKDTIQMKNKCECELFLFEKIIVICLKNHQHPYTYLYYDSVEIDKLSIVDMGDSPEFQLKSLRPDKKGRKVVSTFDMITSSRPKKDEWVVDIQELIVL